VFLAQAVWQAEPTVIIKLTVRDPWRERDRVVSVSLGVVSPKG